MVPASYERHNDKEEFSYSIKAVARRITDVHRMQISYFENAWWQRFVNAGEGSSKVLSFETQFPLKRFQAKMPNLDLSFMWGEPGPPVSFLPKPDNLLVRKISANANLDYKAKDWPLSLGNEHSLSRLNPIFAKRNAP